MNFSCIHLYVQNHVLELGSLIERNAYIVGNNITKKMQIESNERVIEIVRNYLHVRVVVDTKKALMVGY